MPAHRNLRSVAIFLVLLLAASVLLGACKSKDGKATVSGLDAVFTSAAQTMEVQLTETDRPAATQPLPTNFPITPLPALLDTPTPKSVVTPGGPTITPGDTNCDAVEFISDVSIPDDSEIDAGASFTKIWRLKNIGTCTWTTAYNLVFIEGERMEAPWVVPLSNEVAPGATIDISVALTAPAKSGTYRGDFKLRNANNAVFGLGELNDPFWVQIKVKGSSAGVAFDFVSQARQAIWASGQENAPGAPLTFDGVNADPNGVAAIRDGILLETNAVSGKVLLTFPKHVMNGFIAGVFPAYAVRKGDYFKARLGFAKNPTGECGAGKVLFQFGYQQGTTITILDEWSDTCDGEMIQVEVDLSDLAGEQIQFVFVVRAQGAYQDAWAIWNSPLIQR